MPAEPRDPAEPLDTEARWHFSDDPLTQSTMNLLAAAGVRPFTAHRVRAARAANSRLVAMVGLALLVLLPVPYVSALGLDTLWRVHYFSGLVVIPLLGLKLAGTTWRALRYYLGDPGFRQDGPPHPMPRITAPILVLSTIVLFGSGVDMLLGADRVGSWSTACINSLGFQIQQPVQVKAGHLCAFRSSLTSLGSRPMRLLSARSLKN